MDQKEKLSQTGAEARVNDRVTDGDRLDEAAVVDGHGVGAVWLATPGGEGAVDGVEGPDFEVAAGLIDGELFGDVDAAG